MSCIETQQVVRVDLHRCYGCGRWWGLDTFAIQNGECPCCARRTIDQLREEIVGLEKRIVSLRGVVTRMKKR